MEDKMHYGLEGLVDENTYFQDIPKARQADSVRDFYDDSDNRHQMWAELETPTKSNIQAVATRNRLDVLLEVALRASLTGTDSDRDDAYRRLGDQLTAWAYNYAERRLDAYIDSNLEDLMLDESDLRANALGV